MKNESGPSKTVNQGEIAEVAYTMWEKAGHPANRDLQFWLDAEAQLRAAGKAATAPPAANPSPVDLKNNAGREAAKVKPGLSQPNVSKPQQKVPRF